MYYTYIFKSNRWNLKQLFIYNKGEFKISTVTFENVCRVQTKRQVLIKMCKFSMVITAVCVKVILTKVVERFLIMSKK